jgi:hypothetical protein
VDELFAPDGVMHDASLTGEVHLVEGWNPSVSWDCSPSSAR